MCSGRVSPPVRMLLLKAYGFPGGVGETVNAPLILPTYTSDNNELVIVTTETETDRDKTSQAQPMSKHIHPHKLRNVLLLAAEVSKRGGGTVVGGWHWLAAGGQRRTSRTHHHPCCGVLCINRLEVAEQGLCDTFGHNIYLIKLLLLPSLPDLDNNDGD